MNSLDKITRGKIIKPLSLALFGPHGAGKTTFACNFPNPIISDLESGSNQINVDRLPLAASFSEVLLQMEELFTTNHPYKTYVLDALDSLEMMCWKEVCLKNSWKSIETAGFGKGYIVALEEWSRFLKQIARLREKMNVILIAHSQIKTMQDPMKAQPYDRHELKLNKAVAAATKEALDAVLFCTFEVHVKTTETGKGKAYGDGKRIMYTEGRPGHEGKNRYRLPYELELSYPIFIQAYQKALKSDEDPKAIIDSINGKIGLIKDEGVKLKSQGYLIAAGQDIEKLLKLETWIQTATGEKI